MLAYPDHHSPSSIKAWRNSPIVWCLRYLWDWKDGGPKMWRGSAVEAGFAAYLRGGELGIPLSVACEKYRNERTRFHDETGKTIDDHEFDEQHKLIGPMLNQAIAWHNRTTWEWELAATQIPVKTYLDGVVRPFIGYVDFSFLDTGDLDTKSTEACPSKPRPDDVRQVAVYAHARDWRPQSLLYVTDKKHACYTPSREDLEAALQEMAAAAASLELFLSIMPDRKTALFSLPGNDHFSFNEAAKAKLAEIGV